MPVSTLTPPGGGAAANSGQNLPTALPTGLTRGPLSSPPHCARGTRPAGQARGQPGEPGETMPVGTLTPLGGGAAANSGQNPPTALPTGLTRGPLSSHRIALVAPDPRVKPAGSPVNWARLCPSAPTLDPSHKGREMTACSITIPSVDIPPPCGEGSEIGLSLSPSSSRVGVCRRKLQTTPTHRAAHGLDPWATLLPTAMRSWHQTRGSSPRAAR